VPALADTLPSLPEAVGMESRMLEERCANHGFSRQQERACAGRSRDL